MGENRSLSNGQKANIPKLRFPGFEGEWRTISLGKIASVVKRTDSKSTAPIMMLSAGNGFIMQSVKYSRDNAGQSLKKYTLLKKGEMAYNHGASKVKQFGCCYELREEEARIPYVYHCFKIDEREHSSYIALLLNNPKMDKQLKRLISSSVRMDGLLNISFDDYMSVKLSLPSLSEQKYITSFIEMLEERIVAQKQLVEALKKYKRGLLSAIFPKRGKAIPKYRLSGFTEPWEQCRLGELVQIERGGSPRPINDYITDSPNGLNWVKIGDAPTQGLYITKTAEKIRPEGLSKTREVHPGDLILSNSMSFGKPYIMSIDGCIHDGWLLIRDKYKVFDLVFLCHMLSTPHMLNQYKSLAAGSTVNNLNKELVGNTVVTIPEINEQRILGTFLEQVDRLITFHQHKLDMFNKTKSSLIQQLFI